MVKYLKFSSETCPPCKILQKQLDLMDTSFVEIECIDVHKDSEKAKEYGAMCLPFVVKLVDGVRVKAFHGSYLIDDIEEERVKSNNN